MWFIVIFHFSYRFICSSPRSNFRCENVFTTCSRLSILFIDILNLHCSPAHISQGRHEIKYKSGMTLPHSPVNKYSATPLRHAGEQQDNNRNTNFHAIFAERVKRKWKQPHSSCSYFSLVHFRIYDCVSCTKSINVYLMCVRLTCVFQCFSESL